MNTESKKWYDKTWLVVVLLFVFFPVGLYALWMNSGIGKGWKISVTVVIALLVIAGMSEDKPAETQKATVSAEPKVKEKNQSNWVYREDADKMTGTKRFYGTTFSTNQLEFEFPYSGGSTFQLSVRNQGEGNEVVLQVDKGQFMSGLMDNEYLRIKFDEEQPFNVTYNSSADGSANVIFPKSSAKIISKLKTSNKLMIEAPFFNEGRQVIEFDIKGFNWDK